MSELLPCPFCGGEAQMGINKESTVREYFVGCMNCHIRLYKIGYKRFYTEAEAIAAWNTRAERTCRIEGRYGNQYCTCCGEMVGTWDSESELCVSSNMVELWNYCPNCGARRVGE
jgi:Lar family restriction alleviation protein